MSAQASRQRKSTNFQKRARAIVREHSVPVVPGASLPNELEMLIGDVAATSDEEDGEARHKLLNRVGLSDPKLSMDINSQIGSVMITYGEAGYFVGLMIGIELAAQIRGER